MCCPLVHPEQFKNSYPRDTSTKTFIVQEKCTLHKEYFPSPYETKHLEMAKSWMGLDEDESRKRVMQALIDDIPHVIRWLERVKVHMEDMNVYDFSSASNHNKEQDAVSMLHPDDKQYMSFFKFTRTCGNKVHSWLEFIEPITIHARHPLSKFLCIYASSTCSPYMHRYTHIHQHYSFIHVYTLMVAYLYMLTHTNAPDYTLYSIIYLYPYILSVYLPLALAACQIAGEYKKKLLEQHPDKAAAFGELIDIDYILLKPGNRLMDGIYVNNVHSSVQTNHFFFDAGAG